MSLLSPLSKIKFPDANKLKQIPSNIKTQHKKEEMNTVDVIFCSHDWRKCILVDGLKNRDVNRPIIKLKLPDDLSFFESDNSSIFNKNNLRDLYIVNEKSPYTVPLNKIPLVSSSIKLNPSHDENPNDETLEIDLGAKMLNTFGTVKLIEEVSEKNESGYGMIFLAGGFIFAPLWIFISAMIFT